MIVRFKSKSFHDDDDDDEDDTFCSSISPSVFCSDFGSWQNKQTEAQTHLLPTLTDDQRHPRDDDCDGDDVDDDGGDGDDGYDDHDNDDDDPDDCGGDVRNSKNHPVVQ